MAILRLPMGAGVLVVGRALAALNMEDYPVFFDRYVSNYGDSLLAITVTVY